MRVLVTGAGGCLGAWTLLHLLEAGHEPVAFDLSEDRRRIAALLGPGEMARVRFVTGDLTRREDVLGVFAEHEVERVIHLAALQVPFCRADPPLGMRVNIEGTVHLFEAARQCGVAHVAYASSVAVYGSAEDYGPGLVDDSMPKSPRTLYGVTKVANEGLARVYWQDHDLSSVGLRPYTVYGVGRDQGVTSEPTLALAAAARGQDARISFGGGMQLHWASDVARLFIAAAMAPRDGAEVYDLGGPVVTMEEVARLIEELRPGVRVEVGDGRLPFPEGFDDTPLREAFGTVYQTPWREGFTATLASFERLAREGRPLPGDLLH